jgi:hypothetical protein
MWLAVVGIVYGVSTRADWHAAARRTVGQRAAAFIEKVVPSARLRRSWGVVPTPLRGKVSDYALSKTGQYQPVVDSARLILHGGPVALATYVLAYLGLAWLDTAGSFYSASSDHGYLFRGMAWLIGPNDPTFWHSFTPTLGVVSQLIVVPLRIALIATAFGYCWLHASRAQLTGQAAGLEQESQLDGVVRVGDVDRAGGDVAGQQEVELQGSGLATELGGAGTERVDDAGAGLVLPSPPPVGEDPDARPLERGARPLDGDDR